jgi:histone H3
MKTGAVFRGLPFERIVRGIANDMGGEMRFTEESMKAIQAGTEDYLIALYRAAGLAANHAGRLTLMEKDLMVVEKIRGGL